METAPFLKKGKRSLSEFMAGELLYDYATHKLDFEREQAVKEAIENNPHLGKELDDIIYGITYCKHLSQTQTKPELFGKMEKSNISLNDAKTALNMRKWNIGYQWVTETLLISFIFILVVLFLPWQNLMYKFIEPKSSNIMLTEIKKDKTFKSMDEASRVNSQPQKFEIIIDKSFDLKVSNPVYTIHKFPIIIKKMGASLEEQENEPRIQNQVENKNDMEVEKKFIISVPQNKVDTVIKELSTHGELSILNQLDTANEQKQILNFSIHIRKITPLKSK